MKVSIQSKKDNSDAIKRLLFSSIVVAGITKDAAGYSDGTSVVEVATDHEFGSPKARTYTSPRGNSVSVSGVPERSFMRSTAKENREKWKKTAVHGVASALKGLGVNTVLNSMGGTMASAIKAKIVAIQDPPNSPQVIEDKKSNNPLIDTGHMLESITYDVRSK